MKKVIALLMMVVLILSWGIGVNAYVPLEEISDLEDYNSYISNSENSALYGKNITLKASECVQLENAEFTSDEKHTILLNENGFVEWNINSVNAKYNIALIYKQVIGEKLDNVISLSLNGAIPFDAVDSYELDKLYRDDINGEFFEVDTQGNDVIPSVSEADLTQKLVLRDTKNTGNAYSFVFLEGENTLRITAKQGSIMIESVVLFAEENISTYKQASKDFDISNNGLNKNYVIKIQAEKSLYRNTRSIVPQADRSSPTTDPFKDGNKKSLNYISGEKWNSPGSYLTWSFYVENTGYYKIILKNRQRYKNDLFVSRKMLIDGKQIYSELGNLQFFYTSDWTNYTVGDEENAYLFYLEKGTHTITLEAVLGTLSETIKTVEDSLASLNKVYQDILMIAGTAPDSYRDYNFDKQIPDSIESLGIQADKLREVSKKLTQYAGSHGSNTALLDRIATQLEEMNKKPRDIASRFSAFKDNIGALGTWILDIKNQSLDLDYILVTSPEYVPEKAEATFFEKIIYELKKFILSFSEDYQGSVGYESIEVWLATGRDQMNSLQKTANNSFGQNEKVDVNIKLVQAAALLPAIAAGGGPDVYLQANYTDAVNYAIRGAVVDLSKYEGIDNVLKRFDESAIVPFRYKEGLYALPETQDFPMLFYRTDILKELNLSIPETWDEVLEVIPILQNNNLEFAFPVSTSILADSGLATFYMFLLQNGGHVYKEDRTTSDLSSEASIKAFKQWTNYYVNYDLSLTYDPANRFRTGETPLMVANYTLYNQLQVSAPEIRGLWNFCPVPGTKDADGNINRSVASTGLCCMMLENSNKKDLAWKFLKWWTSSDTQAAYGMEIENVLGSSARYSSANLEALQELPWSSSEYARLKEQRKYLCGIPQVPGSYFIARHLNNAFRKTVIALEEPRETILEYAEVIDREIIKKTEEFSKSEY